MTVLLDGFEHYGGNMPGSDTEWLAAAAEIINSPQSFYDPFVIGKTTKSGKVKEHKDEDMPPTKAKEGFTFGCDPEVFLKNKEGVHMPPTGIIPGTKEQPERVAEGVSLQIDGMAAEFNIDPATTFEEFDSRIVEALSQIKKLLPKGWSIDICPFVRFDPDVFDAAEPRAKELGCHPDFDAWTGGINPPPGLDDDPYLRTAAGHLHIGWTKDADLTDPQHIVNCRDLVRQLDWYLGGWTVAQEPDNTRRKLYGKAGACRYKSYGVEYRVPSNFWIKTKESRLLVWNRMQAAITEMSRYFYPDRAAGYADMLVQGINSGQLDDYLIRAIAKYPIMSLDQRLRSI